MSRMYTNMPSGCLFIPEPIHMTVQISHSDVVIGFERTNYTVGETDGQVNLTVRVLKGRVSDVVRLRLTTQDDTALGKAEF